MNSGHFHINSVNHIHPPQLLMLIEMVETALPYIALYKPKVLPVPERSGWRSQAVFTWAGKYSKAEIRRRLLALFDQNPAYDMIKTSITMSKENVKPDVACRYVVAPIDFPYPAFSEWLTKAEALELAPKQS